jgi:hypothetical protein
MAGTRILLDRVMTSVGRERTSLDVARAQSIPLQKPVSLQQLPASLKLLFDGPEVKQGCQIFICAIYQKGEKYIYQIYTKKRKCLPARFMIYAVFFTSNWLYFETARIRNVCAGGHNPETIVSRNWLSSSKFRFFEWMG